MKSGGGNTSADSHDPNLESGVTVRSRRRRRPPSQRQPQSLLVSSETEDNIILQESPKLNFSSKSRTLSLATSPNKLSDKASTTTGTGSTSSMKHRNAQITKGTHPNRIHDEFLQQFRTSVQKVTSPVSIWSKHPTLIQHVITTSMMLQTTMWNNSSGSSNSSSSSAAKDRHHTSTTTSLLLEDHAMDILSNCRTLVKEATDDTGNDTRNDDRLFLSVHGLRAILSTHTIFTTPSSNDQNQNNSNNTSKLDTIRRLLYFCILQIGRASCRERV